MALKKINIFRLLNKSKKEIDNQLITFKSGNRNLARFSIAALFIVLLGIGTYSYFNYDSADQNQNLGTYDDPEIALRETQKALSMLSTHLNTGIESLYYVQEYENSKSLIFK